MLRDKRFLTGLGAGLILGAMLLQLMTLATAGPREESGLPDAAEAEAFPEDERRVGEALADTAPDAAGGGGPAAGEDADESGGAHADGEGEAAAGSAPGAARDPAAASGGDGDEREAAPEAADDGPGGSPVAAVGSDAAPHYYLIHIRAGMISDEVGEMLHAAGLVDDLDEYRTEMARRGLTVKIRAGTYTFAYKPDLSALIDAITLDAENRP